MTNIMKKIILILFLIVFASAQIFGSDHEVYAPDGKGGWVDSNGNHASSGSGDHGGVGSGSGWGGPGGSSGGSSSGGASGGGESGGDYYGHESSGGREGGRGSNNNQNNRTQYERALDQENAYLKAQAEQVGNLLAETSKHAEEFNNLSATILASNSTLNVGRTAEIQTNEMNLNKEITDLTSAQLEGNVELLYNANTLSSSQSEVDIISPPGLMCDKIFDLKTKLVNAHPTNPQGQFGKNLGLVAVDQAEKAYLLGNQVAAETYYRVGVASLDLALGLIPVVGFAKCLYEGLSGKSIITGESLSTGARILSLAGASVLGFGPAAFGALGLIENVAAKIIPSETQALADLTSRAGKLLSEMENITIHEGSTLNRELEALGRQPSYVEGAVVIRGDSRAVISLYRGHRINLPIKDWSAIKNPLEVGRAAYSDLLAVDMENIQEVSVVKPPVGTPLEVSLAGRNKWGAGGGLQVRILNTPQKEWFTKIGSFVKGDK